MKEEEEKEKEAEYTNGYKGNATRSSFKGKWRTENPMGILNTKEKQPNSSIFELIETISSSVFSPNA